MLSPFFSRGLALLLLALSCSGAVAQDPKQLSNKPEPTAANAKVPPAEDLLILLRDALAALNQANRTGNYTVLQALGTPEFQQKNSAAQLGNVFAPLRERGISLFATLIVTPQLTVPPLIAPDGTLRLEGSFPTKPFRLNFVAVFKTPDWRLAGLTVTAQAETAPAAPTPQSVTKPTEGKKPADSKKPAEKKK